MKLNKSWYQASAREIIHEVGLKKRALVNLAKENQEKEFWASEDGQEIQRLKDKYNVSCKLIVFNFILNNYLPYIPEYQNTPSDKLIDKMVLIDPSQTSVTVLEAVRQLELKKLMEFCLKKKGYETISPEYLESYIFSKEIEVQS